MLVSLNVEIYHRVCLVEYFIFLNFIVNDVYNCALFKNFFIILIKCQVSQ